MSASPETPPVELLHRELLENIPFVGSRVASGLLRRAEEVAVTTQDAPDPDISVVIRSKNNADQLSRLFDDLERQSFNGGVELIVVDTESDDDTPDRARTAGAQVLNITQAEFSYPKALNMGFEAASNPWVLSLVDHSRLGHNQILRVPSQCRGNPDIAAVSSMGVTLPNANASKTELLARIALIADTHRQPRTATKLHMGIMAANASFIHRDAWEDAGHFDEEYGAGGEDGALAQKILTSGGQILIDRAMAVHHTHGLSLVDSIQEFRYWGSLTRPRNFSQEALAAYRPDLREES